MDPQVVSQLDSQVAPQATPQAIGQGTSEASVQQQELLQQLKDVAQPDNPGWWPPAPGWWLVLFGLLLIAGILYWLIKKRATLQSSNEWRSSALAEHRQLQQLYRSGEDKQGVLANLSVLMRRVALAVEPRSRIASLTDDQWLSKLDEIGRTTEYTNGVGSVLYRHQYQREQQLDDEAVNGLFDLTANTIKSASPVMQSEGESVAAV